jgi:hypothetical protein
VATPRPSQEREQRKERTFVSDTTFEIPPIRGLPTAGSPRANKAQAIRNARRKHEIFVLRYTAEEPIEVEVRTPDIASLIGLGLVPVSARELVNQLIRQADIKSEAEASKAASKLVEQSPMGAIEAYTDLVNATVIAGFVNPKVVLHLKDVVDDDTVWIDDIDYRDRTAYFEWINVGRGQEADAVKSGAGGPAGPDPVATPPPSEELPRARESGGHPVYSVSSPTIHYDTNRPLVYYNAEGHPVTQSGHPIRSESGSVDLERMVREHESDSGQGNQG